MNSRIILLIIGLLFSFSALADTPPKKTPALLEKGKTVFISTCVTCHGVKGDGMGDAGQYMSPKPRNLKTGKFKQGETVSDVFNTITKGIDGTAMVGFPLLSEEDRWATAYYVLTFKEKK